MLLEHVFSVAGHWQVVDELHVGEDQVEDLESKNSHIHILSVAVEVHPVSLVDGKVYFLLPKVLILFFSSTQLLMTVLVKLDCVWRHF